MNDLPPSSLLSHDTVLALPAPNGDHGTGGDGTAYSRARTQSAWQRLRPRLPELFTPHAVEHRLAVARCAVPSDGVRAQVEGELGRVLAAERGARLSGRRLVKAQRCRRAAESVPTPELPVLTLGEPGILHEVIILPSGTVRVDIVPTCTGCPAVDIRSHHRGGPSQAA